MTQSWNGIRYGSYKLCPPPFQACMMAKDEGPARIGKYDPWPHS